MLLALAVVCAVSASGCAVRVSGFVTDAGTGHPVERAGLTIGDRYTQVDTAGHYDLKARLNTKEKLVFAAPGYETQYLRFRKRDERFPKMNVQLVPTEHAIAVPPAAASVAQRASQ
jgi:hypothetical protein